MKIRLVLSFRSAPIFFENPETGPDSLVKMQALKVVNSKRGKIVIFDNYRFTINKKHQYLRIYNASKNAGFGWWQTAICQR